MGDSPVKCSLERDGRLLKLALARPKANIVDAEMITALQGVLDQHRDISELAAVLLTAEGPNFSFGASVEEHLPGQCEDMLKNLHKLVITMLDYPLPILVSVRGFCLGGGLEVAIAGNLIFADPDSSFGQPEIQLAVFAPAASCLLPERIGQAQAEDMLLSGRNIKAEQALNTGLVNKISDDPDKSALDYFDKYLLPHSSYALRHATWAARHDFCRRMKEKIQAVEQRYLEQLMNGDDPVEGLTAFTEKRSARWTHS